MRRHQACEGEAAVEGRLTLRLHDEDRDAVAEALAEVLLAALEREGVEVAP